VLGEVDFSVHLAGPSGVFKTEVAALHQSHFGSAFGARSLPGSWSSTENALEELAYAAKDMLVTVDDFKPIGGSYEVQSYHRKADRLLRAVGNHCGRQRLTREGRLRPERRPRGLVLSTGEEIPGGQSLRARQLISEVGYGDIPRDRLTRCQRHAAAGDYAAAMSGFLCWLAKQYAEVRLVLKHQVTALRDKALAEMDPGHARVPGIIGELAVGLQHLFDFAVAIGALMEAERSVLARRCWAALKEAAAAQAVSVEAAEPTAQFVRLLTAALASGRAHLAGADGTEPAEPRVWGWRQCEVGGGDNARTEWRPQGRRVGWVVSQKVGLVGSINVFLEPEASFAEVQAFAREQGESLAISPRTLHRRLKDRGLLVGTDQVREVLTVRRVLEGQRREVLHLRAELLYHPPDQPDHSGRTGPETSSACGREATNGRYDPTTDPTSAGCGPDHGTHPATDPTTASPCLPSGNGDVVGLVGSQTNNDQASGKDRDDQDREVFEV
jgi:hypothetical protein